MSRNLPVHQDGFNVVHPNWKSFMKVVHRQVVSDDLVLDDNGSIEVNGDAPCHISPKRSFGVGGTVPLGR